MPTNTVSILRELWSKRRLVACAAIVALVAGYAVDFGASSPLSKKNTIGSASVRLLVDTPSSQVVAVAPAGIDLLNARANLLASLMVDGVVKDTIAQKAGLRPDKLLGIAGSVVSADIQNPASQTPYVLTSSVLNDSSGQGGSQLPIIVVGTQAPTPSGAAALANAAVVGLKDYLDSLAATQKIPVAHRLRVTSLGAPVATDVVRGSGIALGFGLAVFIFVAGCMVILIVPAIVAEWRAASEEPVPLAVVRPGASSPGLRTHSPSAFRRASASERPQVHAPGDGELEIRPPEADASRG
jgi:hypothetical protein